MARQPLNPEALARLIERLAPGGRPLTTRRLRGGVSSRMDVIQIERADGTRFAISLRRSAPGTDDHAFLTPEQMARQYAVLQIVEAAGLPAPRPLLLDAGGELFGVPAMAVSYLPGRPFFAHDNAAAWTDALARAIYEVHTVTPDRFDLTGLGLRGTDWARGKITRLHE